MEENPVLVPVPNTTICDFSLINSKVLYVDKTLFLKELMDNYPAGGVLLFTRPRRFGKTMLATMVQTFFEMPGSAVDAPADRDNSVLFQDKKIWACGPEYRAQQGSCPVIWLTFKDAMEDSWEDMYLSIYDSLIEEARRHLEIWDSNRCDAADRKYLHDLMEHELKPTQVKRFLKVLTRMLSAHYGAPCVLLIDEYDTPLQVAALHRYYGKAKNFYGGLLSGGLKNNKNLKYGILTGILRGAKAGIFSGLNNLDVFTVLDTPYSGYFGFTEDEVREIARIYGKEDRLGELYRWYDGYRFGNTRIFNPLSVLKYFQADCLARAYWVETSENSLLQDLFAKARPQTLADILALASWSPEKEPIRREVNISVIYPEMSKSDTSLLSFLLMTGYLKCENVTPEDGEGTAVEDYVCDLSIPNREVMALFSRQIVQRFFPDRSTKSRNLMQDLPGRLRRGDAAGLEEVLRDLLVNVVSSHDIPSSSGKSRTGTEPENAYHILLLGLLFACLRESYIITSNREAGEGRYDIQLKPRRSEDPGIVMELKVQKDQTKNMDRTLRTTAMAAIRQARELHYDADLHSAGVENIHTYGIAFYKKRVAVLLADPEN